MSIPAILGAAVLKLTDINSVDLAANVGPYLAGMLVAAAVGYICIRWLKNLIQKHQFHYFRYYCLAVGLIAIVCGVIL